MAMAKMGKAFKRTMRWLWLTMALLIIGTVILVVIGRQTITGVDYFRADIQQMIEDQIGLRVELGELNGEWPRLTPILDIERAEVFAEDNSPAVVISGGRADLDLFESIARRTPIWRELVVDSLRLTMVEDDSGHWRLKGFGSNSDADLSLFIDPLIYSRLIRFQDVQVVLQFFSGKSMLLSGRNMAMENANDFHRAELSVILSEQEVLVGEGSPSDSLGQAQSPAYLLIEGHGDSLMWRLFSPRAISVLMTSIFPSLWLICLDRYCRVCLPISLILMLTLTVKSGSRFILVVLQILRAILRLVKCP